MVSTPSLSTLGYSAVFRSNNTIWGRAGGPSSLARRKVLVSRADRTVNNVLMTIRRLNKGQLSQRSRIA